MKKLFPLSTVISLFTGKFGFTKFNSNKPSQHLDEAMKLAQFIAGKSVIVFISDMGVSQEHLQNLLESQHLWLKDLKSLPAEVNNEILSGKTGGIHASNFIIKQISLHGEYLEIEEIT